MSIALVMLSWNGKADTLECLQSLRKVASPSLRIIVVDNGSEDDSVNAIRSQFPEVHLIENRENLGFAEGNNVGIRYALETGAQYLLLLNNDTVVDPNILEAFLAAAQAHPQAGIFGAKIYLYDEPQKLDHLGGTWNRKKGCFDLIGLREIDDGARWESAREVDYACGAVLFVRRAVFETVGLLENRFFVIWEEADFCFLARKAGFSTMSIPQAKIWHKVSASFVGGKPHSTYFWWRNRLLWIERNCAGWQKWGLFLRVVILETFLLWKLTLLKTVQLKLLQWFRPKDDLNKRKERILKYRAALQGIKDYVLRRFGNGPAWIYGKGKI